MPCGVFPSSYVFSTFVGWATDLDLDAKVKTIDALVKAVEARGSRHHNGAVRVALDNVEDALGHIKELGSVVDAKLDAFELVYFQSWRSPGIDEELTLLRHYGTVLDQRVDMLIKMMAIPAGHDASHAHADDIPSSCPTAVTYSAHGSGGDGNYGGLGQRMLGEGTIIGVTKATKATAVPSSGGEQKQGQTHVKPQRNKQLAQLVTG